MSGLTLDKLRKAAELLRAAKSPDHELIVPIDDGRYKSDLVYQAGINELVGQDAKIRWVHT